MDKMSNYQEAIPKLIFEIFYTKLGWSSRLSDTQEKQQEICIFLYVKRQRNN